MSFQFLFVHFTVRILSIIFLENETHTHINCYIRIIKLSISFLWTQTLLILIL